MRMSIAAPALVGAAFAAAVLAPAAAQAANPTPLPDQLIVCSNTAVKVLVENVQYNSIGRQSVAVPANGCTTLVDGSTTGNPNGTPIEGEYRVTLPNDALFYATSHTTTITTTGDPNPNATAAQKAPVTTHYNTSSGQQDDADVRINSLKGVLISYAF